MNITPGPWTVGAILAVLVILLAVVLAIMGQLPWLIAGFLIALGVARLL